MRPMGLLAVLFLAVVTGGASAADHDKPAANNMVPLLSEHIPKPSANSATREFKLPDDLGNWDSDSLIFLQSENGLPVIVDFEPGEVCYTMQTYRVERDAPDSDTVHPAGNSNCQTASNFEVKAVHTGTEKVLRILTPEGSPEVK